MLLLLLLVAALPWRLAIGYSIVLLLLLLYTHKTQHVAPAGFTEVQGEIAYRSPEGLGLFEKPEEHLVGFPSDMWSVGCLLLELLIRQPAFISTEMRSESAETQIEHTKERQLQWVSLITA